MVEDKGVTILIDSQAQIFVFGTELDYAEDAAAIGLRLPQAQ